MADAKQNPETVPHPKDQVGENKGAIKGPQVTEHSIDRKDTPAGSGPETRGNSRNRT